MELSHEFISQHEATAEEGYSTESLSELLALTSGDAAQALQEDAEWYQASGITQVGASSITDAEEVAPPDGSEVAVEVTLDSSDVSFREEGGETTEPMAETQSLVIGMQCEPEWSVVSLTVSDDGV